MKYLFLLLCAQICSQTLVKCDFTLQKFADLLIRPTPPNTCSVNTDANVFFVIDGSRSVPMTTFHLIAKNVITDIINKMSISRNSLRVSVVVFSNDIRYVIPLDRYSEKTELLKAVMSLNYPGGWTDFSKMLKGLCRLMRVAQMTEKEPRPNYVVILTDGVSTHGHSDLSMELTDLHSEAKATFVVSLKENNYENKMLSALSSYETVFHAKDYTKFARTLIQTLHGNPSCWNVCYRYERDTQMLDKLVRLLVEERNRLFTVLMTRSTEERSLLKYTVSILKEIEKMTANIKETCGDESSLSQKLEELQFRYSNVTTTTGGAGLNLEVVISQLITSINAIHESIYKIKSEIMSKQSVVSSRRQEFERLEIQYKSILDAKQLVSSTYEKNINEIEEKMTRVESDITVAASSLKRFESLTAELTVKVEKEVIAYQRLEKEYRELTKRFAMVSKILSGEESSVFIELRQQLTSCSSYISSGFESVFFSMNKGCGKSFVEELESSRISSYTSGTFNNSMDYFKSFQLSRFFVTGSLRFLTLRLLKNRMILADVTFDTKSKSLLDFMGAMQVMKTNNFAKFVLQSYSFVLNRNEEAEFEVFIGDLREYQRTQKCEDLRGFLLVLSKPHRCYPDTTKFPAFFTSESRLGGSLTVEIDSLQLISGDFPDSGLQLPAVQTPSFNQTWNIVLVLSSGAGDSRPLLQTDTFTPDYVLSRASDLNQLHQHYKSYVLTRMALPRVAKFRMDIRNEFGTSEAQIEWLNAGTHHHYLHQHGVGHLAYSHQWTSWFNAHNLYSAYSFKLSNLRESQFLFNIRNEFFAIGINLEQSCEKRRYFVLVLNGQDPCQCFPSGRTPEILFAKSEQPLPCSQLQKAHQLRLLVQYSNDIPA